MCNSCMIVKLCKQFCCIADPSTTVIFLCPRMFLPVHIDCMNFAIPVTSSMVPIFFLLSTVLFYGTLFLMPSCKLSSLIYSMLLYIVFSFDIGFFVHVFLVVSALYFVLCVCMFVLSIGSVCSYVCCMYFSLTLISVQGCHYQRSLASQRLNKTSYLYLQM